MTRTHKLMAIMVFAIAVAACSSADAAPTTTMAAPAPLPSGTIEVMAVDFGFEGLPPRVHAGTTFELVNESSMELHEFVAIRLPDDEKRPVSELLQLPPEEFAAFFPYVDSVVLAPPESGGFAAVGSGTLEKPGRYAIICAIPTGANPDEYLAAAAESEGGPPDVPGGPPHFAHGMYAEVIVE